MDSFVNWSYVAGFVWAYLKDPFWFAPSSSRECFLALFTCLLGGIFMYYIISRVRMGAGWSSHCL